MIVFLITSVLQPCSRPLIYTARRSRYTCDQRYHQLLETVESIQTMFLDKKKEIYILVVEGSNVHRSLPVDVHYVTSPLVDSYWKGLGEAFLLQEGIQEIQRRFPNQVDHLFKLSGGYKLNNCFQLEIFLNSEKSIFRQIEKGSVFFERQPCLYTFFFKIGKDDVERFKQFCQKMIERECKESIEVLIFREFSRDCVLVEELGVEGKISHSG